MSSAPATTPGAAAQRAAVYQWRKRSVFLVTSLAWVAAYMFMQDKLRPIQVVRTVRGAAELHSSSAAGACPPPPPPGPKNPTSVEWTARAKKNVRFGNDPTYEVAVYDNNFLGSTLWRDYWDLVDRGQWEPQTLTALKYFLGGKGVGGSKAAKEGAGGCSYIDFGAWIGPTVLFAGLLCEHVYALEPDPLAYSALVANINANPEVAARTTAFFECISAEAGPLEMEGTGDSTSRMTGKLKWDRAGGQKWTVPCRTLPGFIEDNGVTDLRLVKIDVEGAEVYLLPALKPWLDAFGPGKKPAVWLSIHMPFWSDTSDAKKKGVWDVIASYAYVYTQDGKPVQNGADKFADLCTDFCTYLVSDEPYTP